MDPREKRFLAGEPPELIQKPRARRDRFKTDPIWTEEDDTTPETE